mgnify:CR=1 FL=1
MGEGRDDDSRDFKWNNYISRYHMRHLDLMDLLAMYQPRASAPLDDLAKLCGFPGKLGVDGSQVWILRADGVVAAYDGPSLRPLGETRTRGSGPGFLAAWGGALWSLGADQAAGTTTVLTRIARDTQAATIEVRFPGRFPAALSRTDGRSGWVGLGEAAGIGSVVPVDANGSPGAAIVIAVPSSLVVAAGDLWWTSHDGQVGRIDGATPWEPLSLPTASGLAWSHDLVWVASDRLILIAPAP